MNFSDLSFYNIYMNGSDFLILLKENGYKSRFLPMLIGSFEASNILMALEKIIPDRPFLSDLLFQFIEDNSFILEKMVINKLNDGIFFSELSIKNSAGTSVYPIRPSDGLALTLRANAPIYVSEEILKKIEEDPAVREILQIINSHSDSGPEGQKWEELPLETRKNPRLFIGQNHSLLELKEELESAINEENYEKAALIRDKIMEYKKISESE